MKDHYQTLGVNSSATLSEIKNNYRKLALKFHPDKNGGNLHFSDRFSEVQQAYAILSNIEKRKNFDRIWNSWYEENKYYTNAVKLNEKEIEAAKNDYTNYYIILVTIVIIATTLIVIRFDL